MTKIKVLSSVCGINHTIMGKVEGDRIIVEIDTPCEKFRDLSPLEFPLQELSDIQGKLTMKMSRKTECCFECALDFTRSCLIPSAVFNVCSIEKGNVTATPFDSSGIIIPEFESPEFENPGVE
jgi:hypothetical protein